ncbi:hypothetical protein B0I31_111109 [Saccharothrix carnea]|uniref:Outer membrane channel protein CpnT-like N-terminal domain-containing protein n=1 Tax=Saccharothrix carnea TaxID=1280637 RepID=A0A2P8I2Y8_SACCR|nr:hypothetical protein [Saccharothrix carnea]PSL52822.1 hypothetical protein B0I31_111109 [Saccharothrix carnea]
MADACAWPPVNALVEWPDTDEDVVRLLAAEWGEAAGHTEPLSRLDLGPIGAAWADPPGQAFHGRMTALGTAAGEVGTRMRALQTLAAAFATDVTSAKQTIVDVINANIPLYAKAAQLDPAVAASTQDRFVTEIAAWLNAYLASLAGHGPLPPPFVPPEGPAEEEENWGKTIGDAAGVVSAVAGTGSDAAPYLRFATDQFTGNATNAGTAAKFVQGGASMFAQTPEFYGAASTAS